MGQPVEFSAALQRLPIGGTYTVEIQGKSSDVKNVNLIGTLVRNDFGFVFVEIEAGPPESAAKNTPTKKTATKVKKKTVK